MWLLYNKISIFCLYSLFSDLLRTQGHLHQFIQSNVLRVMSPTFVLNLTVSLNIRPQHQDGRQLGTEKNLKKIKNHNKSAHIGNWSHVNGEFVIVDFQSLVVLRQAIWKMIFYTDRHHVCSSWHGSKWIKKWFVSLFSEIRSHEIQIITQVICWNFSQQKLCLHATTSLELCI